mgnify:FL=1
MKKYARIAFIFIILLILLSIFLVYKVSGKDESQEKIQEKSLSSIKYFDNKFTDLFNEINNIKFENYTISVTEPKEEENTTETNKEDTTGKKSEDSPAEDGNSKKDDSSQKSGDSKKDGSSGSSEKSNENMQENKKKYNIEEKGILTRDTEVNWKQIKNETEKMYTSLYPVILDLYKTNINKEEITNFNREFDKLTKAINDENKKDTLKELSSLYDYLPKFVEECTDDEKEKVVIKTKNDIFRAYSILDEEDWENISDYANDAIQDFSKLAESSEIQKNKYNINKAYIMLKELQGAIELKEKDIFLIKYKNLLEELENM